MPSSAATNRVRVLRLFSRLNVGGPSFHVIFLTAGLETYGYETRLVVGEEAPSEGNLLSLAEERGVKCTRLPEMGREIRFLGDFKAFWRLVEILREFRPQIIHTHTAKAGVLGRLAARWTDIPIVIHTYHGHVLRGYFGPLKTHFFRWLERILASRTHALIAVSEGVKRDLVELGVAPASRIRVISLGLELEPLSRQLPRGVLRKPMGVPATNPLIGIVGRLVPIKDIPTFLAAASRVLRERPDARFAVVGDGEERPALERAAAALGLQGQVHFHGWHRDMRAVYGDLDVVVNCSRNEGTPVAIIEGLAAARPVVATRVGGTPDLLGADRHGLLVPAGDAEALALAILDVLRDPARAQERARLGQRHVLTHHSVGRLLKDMDELYKNLLRDKEAA